MKKRKKIWIPIVSVVLVCAIGAGIGLYAANRKKDPVHVYNITDNWLWTQNWDNSTTTDGMITTDKLQTVYVSATQEVTDVYVQEGQRVSKGSKLMAYDTTLSQLSLDRAKLEIERSKLRLEDAKEQLAEIKKMKPISYPTTPSTTKTTTKATSTTAPSENRPTREFNAGEEYMILGGQGTAGSPRIVWAKQKTTFDNDILAALLGNDTTTYVIVEVREKDKAAGDVISRIGMEITVEITRVPAVGAHALQASASSGDYGVHFLTDVQTNPSGNIQDTTSPESTVPPQETEATEDTSPTEDTDPTENTDPTQDTEPTDPTSPTEPDPGEVYVEVPRYSIVFFQADETPGDDGSTSGSTSGSSSGSTGGVNMNSGYTSSEIAQMRADKEAEIKELQFSIKMAEAEYSIMQKEFDNGVVVSDIDGYVVSVLSPEEALANNEPMIKVSGGGGFLIQGTVSELNLDALTLGQSVEVLDWSMGVTYEGTITAIGDYPAERYGYMGGNPNVSYYPFTVSVDESADLQTGSYAQITYSASNEGTEDFYLENAFIRSENGVSYVYVRGDDGLLEKRMVETGPSLYGSYTMIVSGLSKDDCVAFPYGSNLKVGSPTEEANTSELYENY